MQKFQKKCCGYELHVNSTKFAAAHKQEIEFGLSSTAIVTGGQQQKLQKVWLVMNYMAIVKILKICKIFVALSYLAIVTGGQHAAKASKLCVVMNNTVKISIICVGLSYLAKVKGGQHGYELHNKSQQQTQQILLLG
jgi:hypothetical protein